MVDLQAGDEITIDYCGDSAPLNRSDRLNCIFGFRCGCPMCVEERTDSHFEDRRVVLSKFKDEEPKLDKMQVGGAIQIVQGVVQQVERSYTQGVKYRRLLRAPRQRLSALCCNAGRWDQSIGIMEKVLDWDGPWPESQVLDEVTLTELCYAAGKEAKAANHFKRALKLVETVSGLSPPTFLALQAEYWTTRRFGPFVTKLINKMYPGDSGAAGVSRALTADRRCE
jgi:hypothetical protein